MMFAVTLYKGKLSYVQGSYTQRCRLISPHYSIVTAYLGSIDLLSTLTARPGYYRGK